MRKIVSMLFGRGIDGQRPPMAVLFFYYAFVTAWLTHWTQPESNIVSQYYYYLSSVFILVAWMFVPWVRDPQRRGPALFFVVACSAFSLIDATGAAPVIMMIAMAAITIALGVRAGFIAAFILVALILLRIYLLYGMNAIEFLSIGSSSALTFSLAIIVADLVVRERSANVESQRLLAELESSHANLERAHSELQLKAEQVRDLAIAQERTRLAREVHDAVGHHLTVVRLGLANARRFRTIDPEGAWEEVAQASESAAHALEEVRRAVRALGAQPVEEYGLHGALERLAMQSSTQGISISIEEKGHPRPLEAITSQALYRCAEEGITNALRHARGVTTVVISLSYSKHEVRLAVIDNGQTTILPEPGFGLRGVRARIEQIGGTFAISLIHEGGVQLIATIPYKKEAA